MNCKEFKSLIVKLVDQQIESADRQRLNRHLSDCRQCQEDFKKLKKWKGVSQEMKNKLFPDMAADEYWRHLYNRLERGIGWILVSIGAIIFLALAAVNLVRSVWESSDISIPVKMGIFALVIGFVVLFISVLREKLMIRRSDKYKEIQR